MLLLRQQTHAQRTQVNGFIDAVTYLQNGRVNFTLGEQTTFIKSELNDRFSFLGETVIRYAPENQSKFDIRIERAIIKYNYYGNHNLLIGKHHTPINYWNDTYHRGRVFWPTIDRLLVFAQGIIPQNTTGISLQGLNLGKLRFGYDLMVGNGIGSTDLADNNAFKSITAGVHIKPIDNLRLGGTFYHDVISNVGRLVGQADSVQIPNSNVTQNLLTASATYFGKKFEFIAESTTALNQSNIMGNQRVSTLYLYAGLRFKDKLIPYIRYDNVQYRDREVYFRQDNTQSYIAGLRYEINYLTVVKLEYQQLQKEKATTTDKVSLQLAIGF
ncbi:hypothetical protein [Spirosoma aerophilum]